MLRRTLAALALATTLAPSAACTTVIIASTSAPADTGELEPDTTGEPTREDTDTSTSGEPASSTGTTDETTEPASTSTGPDSSSTGEPADTSTSTTGEDTSTGTSTSGDTDTDASTGTSTTGEPAPSKGLGEDCADDSECVAPGWCSNNAFDQNAPQACTLPCDPSMPDACTVGVCIDSGNNNHRCSGAWPVKAYKHVSAPYQGDTLLPAVDKPVKPIVAYYVDPQPVAIKLQVSAINNPGFGPAKVDAYAADGSPLGTASPGAPLVIEPSATYSILVLQATSDLQSLANVNLSNL